MEKQVEKDMSIGCAEDHFHKDKILVSYIFFIFFRWIHVSSQDWAKYLFIP